MSAQSDEMPQVLVDFQTACRVLSLSELKLRQEMHAGNITAQRIGKKLVFRPEELHRYANDLPSWEPK